ncbi:MAG: M23 family metallopeptidase [Dehalococcoidia bacterium]
MDGSNGVRVSTRGLLRALLLVPLAALAAGCFDRGGEVRVFANGTEVAGHAVTATPQAASTVATLAFTPTPFTSDLDPGDLTGFAFPIAGGCLPSRDEVMPNAPRTYRDGVHEGVDFYEGDVCTPIAQGLPVLAVHAGVVIRADLDYVDITPEEIEVLAAKTSAQGSSDAETLDVYRGRQVWIDHGNGVVSRYAHLSSVADGIDVGVEVAAGDAIGAVGESGTPESVTAPGTELHLHLEVRIGDGFLGEGLAPEAVRRLYERLFGVAEGSDAPAPAPEETPPATEETPATSDEAAPAGGTSTGE